MDEEAGEEKAEHGRSWALFMRVEHNWIEIAAAALMALATMMSAFSAYQSAQWHAKAEEHYSRSDQALIQASDLNDTANQQVAIDAAMMAQYTNAVVSGNTVLANLYRDQAFSKELEAAVTAWEADKVANKPNTPRNPFQMPQYKPRPRVQSEKVRAFAVVQSRRGKTALDHSNSYLLLTVLFASVLFFAGIATKFEAKGVKLGVMGMGGLLFLVSVVLLAVQP